MGFPSLLFETGFFTVFSRLSSRHFQRTMSSSFYPVFSKGIVVKGFGRGSKDLANFPDEVIDTLPSEIETGIYYGLANVDEGPVYKMVMSIGWNPYYKNVRRSMETHILHDFPTDFYGSVLRTCILGHIRAEKSYDSLEALIAAIKSDIAYADSELNSPAFDQFRKHSFFNSVESKENGTAHTGSSL